MLSLSYLFCFAFESTAQCTSGARTQLNLCTRMQLSARSRPNHARLVRSICRFTVAIPTDRFCMCAQGRALRWWLWTCCMQGVGTRQSYLMAALLELLYYSCENNQIEKQKVQYYQSFLQLRNTTGYHSFETGIVASDEALLDQFLQMLVGFIDSFIVEKVFNLSDTKARLHLNYFSLNKCKYLIHNSNNMKISIVVFLIILALVRSQQPARPVTENGPFSGVFAATWLGGFCYYQGISDTEQTKCDHVQYDRWDGESFTVHGLWPNGRGPTLNPFDVSYIQQNATLQAYLRDYMPPQSNSRNTDDPYFLWRHQYEKHGKDYVAILKVKDPNQYSRGSSAAFHAAYFDATVTFYETVQLKKINLIRSHPPTHFNSQKGKGFYYQVTKTQISQLIGVQKDMFLTSCVQTKEVKEVLKEIKICFVIENDLSFTLKNCKQIEHESERTLKDTCPQQFKLLGYAPKPQQSVTLWPTEEL